MVVQKIKFACWNKNNKNKNNKKMERLRNNSLRFLLRLIRPPNET